MLSRRPQALAVTLLVVAGLAFGALGIRVLELERADAKRRDRRRAEQVLGLVAGRAMALALSPQSPADETWTIEDVDAGDPLADAPRDRRLLLREAEYLERTRGDDRGALEILLRLGTGSPATALGRVARLRAGILAGRLGDRDEARRSLAAAAAAPDSLRDPAGTSVRLAAQYHFLVSEMATADSDRLRDLLRLADMGRRLAAPGRAGPGDTIEALAAASPSLDLGASDRTRLEDAAARARLGHIVLRAIPADGMCVVENRVALRRGRRLEMRGPESVVDPAATIEGVEVYASPATDPVPADGVARALEPPLDRLRLVAVPRPDEGGASLVTAGLAAGLSVYALGVLATILALRRSARTARMQADFVAAVSHELKTPITSVRAMAELLADGAAGDSALVTTYSERIGREMERLGATVRNVLDAARIERTGGLPVSLAPLDPAEVVRAVADEVRPRLERDGFRLRVDVRPASRPIPLDRAALEGVLLNLIDNAAKFSAEKKSVLLQAGPAEEEEAYRIEVLDRGLGMTAGERSRLFERFFRGEAARRGAAPGVGLGLHVARQVVEAHGGTLRAEPREGGGSVFAIDIGGPSP